MNLKKNFKETTKAELAILEFGSTCVPCAKMKIMKEL